MSLIFKNLKKFTSSKIEAILTKDYPSLGYEGQLILVKPGYATQYLYPRNIAIPNFPGIKKRLYPDIKDEDLVKRKQYYDEINTFNKKIKNVNIELIRMQSFTNPTLLKKEITVKEIALQIKQKYGWVIETKCIKLEKNLIRFGVFKIEVLNFFNEKFNLSYSFTLNITIIPQKLHVKNAKKTEEEENEE